MISMAFDFKSVSVALGTSETAVRLLASLLFTPAFALIYRSLILEARVNAVVHHVYFTLIGLSVSYFCYGWHTGYIVASLIGFHLIVNACKLVRMPSLAPILIFPYSMSVLISAYYVYATDDYDVNWTTAQCIVTLKMISVAFDWSDGQRDESKLSVRQKKVVLAELPSFLEVLGYTFYIGGFQCGPTFPFRRYKEFAEGTLFSHFHSIPSPVVPAVLQFLKAVFYLAQNLAMDVVFPDKYIYSDDLDEYGLVVRLVFNSIWLRKIFIRYIGIWLLADVSCVLSGVGYNGKDEESGKHKWDGVCAVRPYLFETGRTIQSFILSFNVQTNEWAMNYIFKRLQFLNSRFVSSAAVLLFFSVWHGFHFGYFFGFVCTELFVVLAEKQIMETFKPYLPPWENMNMVTKTMIYSTGMFWKHVAPSSGMIGFVLLDINRTLIGNAKTKFAVHIFVLLWFIAKPLITRALKSLSTYEERNKTQ